MNQSEMIGQFSDLTAVLVREAWGKELYDYSFAPQRSWFANRVPKSSRGIDGLVVNQPVLTENPWAIRGITEDGVTPTADKFAASSMRWELGAAAATAAVSLWQLEACKGSTALMKDMVNAQLEAIKKTIPYFMRMLLWTSSDGIKAMGTVGSISSLAITLSNTNLWHAGNVKDRAKLFEPGMVLQAYRGTAKVGAPVKVTAVAKKTGIISLASNPGLAANDVFVMADRGGLDKPYMSNFPGIFDVIGNANTFQGVNRATAGNEWAQAVIQDGGSAALSYDLVSSFLYDAFNPRQAFTHGDVVRAYFTKNLQEQVRYTPSATYEDGFQFVQIDNTKLVADDDCDRDKIVVPDFENMYIATPGDWSNLFGKGWVQPPKSLWLEYSMIWWGRLVAQDCRKMAKLHTFSIA